MSSRSRIEADAFYRDVVVSTPRLRAAIERAGWGSISRRELATKLGLTEPTLRRWLDEPGVVTTWSAIDGAAARLKVPTEELVERYSCHEPPTPGKALEKMVGFGPEGKELLIAAFMQKISSRWHLIHPKGMIEDFTLPHRLSFGGPTERPFLHAYARYRLRGLPEVARVVVSYRLTMGPISAWADIGTLDVQADHVCYTSHWWTPKTRTVPRNGPEVSFLTWLDPFPDWFMVRSDARIDGLPAPERIERAEAEERIELRQEVGFEVTIVHEQG